MQTCKGIVRLCLWLYEDVWTFDVFKRLDGKVMVQVWVGISSFGMGSV